MTEHEFPLPPEAICFCCGHDRADTYAGSGVVPGVPMHLACWMGPHTEDPDHTCAGVA